MKVGICGLGLIGGSMAKAYKKENHTVYGFDANPEAHEAILDEVNGKIWIADVAQDPYKIGYDIATEMVSYCTNGTVTAPVSLVAPYLVDASNAVAPAK